jgi:hypothetical protein
MSSRRKSKSYALPKALAPRDRLSKLYDPEMEDTAKAVLASLGRIARPYLTEFEAEVLTLIENKMR